MQPYTQTPNSIYAAMPSMGEAELRVVLAVVRMTHGWHRPAAVISLSYFEQATGLSRHGVLAGIRAATRHGHITREPAGRSYSYSLVDNSRPAAAVSPHDQPAPPLCPPQVEVQPAHPTKKETLRENKGIEDMLITISAAAAEMGEAPLENLPWLARRAGELGMGDGDLWCLWVACRKAARRPVGLLLWALQGDGRMMRGKRQGRAGRARSEAHRRFFDEMRAG